MSKIVRFFDVDLRSVRVDGTDWISCADVADKFGVRAHQLAEAGADHGLSDIMREGLPEIGSGVRIRALPVALFQILDVAPEAGAEARTRNLAFRRECYAVLAGQVRPQWIADLLGGLQ